LFEFDRNLAAFDGTNLIGTAGIFSTEMTIPGGSIPMAAVTFVSVKPTHRRRGVLSGVMRRQLEGVKERGEAVATLWASESAIYGRFGYGPAIEMEIVEIPRAHSALRRDLPESAGSMRLLTAEEAKLELPGLHERLRKASPGELARNERWWDIRIFRDPADWRDGYTANRYAVYEGASGPEGYVRYRTKGDFNSWLPNGKLAIEEMFAGTVEASVGMWRYLFGVDLIATIARETSAMDDPIVGMLADPRRVDRKRLDGIWLRVLDIEQALSARSYRSEGRVVFEIRDGFLPWDNGRYELEGGPGGAVCRRTDASPSIVLGMEELGAAYLGGARLETFWRAGRVAGDERAIGEADAMFSWHRLPYCQEHF
ncbi:MAG: GNAT family N-acetyltransferase, partial [Dehalococcoidia bacterium]